MGFVRSMTVSVGWTMLVFLCARTKGQTLGQTPTNRMSLRTPIAGQLTDGTQFYRTPDTTAEGVLREMASRAAVIFVGTVAAVQRATDDDLRGNAAGSVVEVDFAVERAVVGPAAGSVYAMREWAGLWRDSPRFMVGQRLLMLLHGVGPGGLSSPVDGLDGAIPVKTSATPSQTGSQLSALTADNASQDDIVDMRWLLAKTLKSTTLADAPTASPGENFAGALTASPSLGASAEIVPIAAVQPATTGKLTHVLGLLMSWQQIERVSH